MNFRRIPPQPHQESVWDYPRPPRLESSDDRIIVEIAGVILAESSQTMRVLETSHPPVYYIPPTDVAMEFLRRSERRTFCEWKGVASYYDLYLEERSVPQVAWGYEDPSPDFRAIHDYLAFYPSKVDACYVNGEPVQAQPGDFYGGWITQSIVGPFKGGPGTIGW
jgi:uncharacterized protein (DUF427 family)